MGSRFDRPLDPKPGTAPAARHADTRRYGRPCAAAPAAWQHINLHGRYEFLKQTALLNVNIIIRELVEMPMDRAIALVA